MPLYPLWSGALLGDIRRHPSDPKTTEEAVNQDETRDSNSCGENWMKIIKHQIIKGAKRLPCGEFTRKLYQNLKGRFRSFRRAVQMSKAQVRPQERLSPDLSPVPLTEKVTRCEDVEMEQEKWRTRKQAKKKPKYFKSQYYAFYAIELLIRPPQPLSISIKLHLRIAFRYSFNKNIVNMRHTTRFDTPQPLIYQLCTALKPIVCFLCHITSYTTPLASFNFVETSSTYCF